MRLTALRLAGCVLGPGGASGDGDLGVSATGVSSFGEDAMCRLHVASVASGVVYRLEAHTTAPVVSDVGLTRSRFAVASASTALIATTRGTAFRFSLSEPATVTIAIEARVSGRRVSRRCRAATRRLRARPRCARYLARASLVRVLGAGVRSIPFSGRLGRRPLAPGSYRATITARDAAGNASSPRRLTLTVVAA
jgi:hypothetical protein